MTANHKMSFEPFTFILERVGQLLVEEVRFLATDKDELLRKLRQQLELAQSFVMDVEDLKQQSSVTHVLETESQHIRQIIPQFEDYLDDLYFEEESKKIQPTPSPIQKFMSCFSFSSNPLVHRHVVIDAALKLIGDLQDTRKKAGSYQRPSNVVHVTQERGPESLPDVMNEEEVIVGLDEDVKTLVNKLKETDGERTTILAITGMGGSGKTTLTRKLFNHEEVKRHFEGRLAWVCVSQGWDASNNCKLLREVCTQLDIPIKEAGEFSNVGFQLRKFLRTSSCLVVLDDVWKMKALQELLPSLLPRGGREGNGKVLITTRNKEILDYQVQANVYIHEARALTPKESWELFSSIIRRKWRGKWDFDEDIMFENLGKQMLERCNGLALAIVALAGLLSVTYSIQDWISLKDRVSSTILRQNKGLPDYGAVKSMLELSYSDLRNDLKPCFLYLGIYPEDSRIWVDELIHLWIAEGLIRSDLCNQGQTLEELGMDYVKELVQRCMVQVVNKTYTKNVDTIQIHDLMRELCVEKARESGFYDIASQLMIPSNIKEYSLSRRAVSHDGRRPHLVHTSRLRSIIIRYGQLVHRDTKSDIAYGEMKLLRVLHLKSVDLTNSALEIGNLTLLRYLRFENCRGVTNDVLESIKKLINLVTLVLKLGWIQEVRIPNNMVGSMKQLRHLQVTWRHRAHIERSFGVGGAGSLQSLKTVAGEWLSRELPTASFVLTLRMLYLYEIRSQGQLDAVYRFVINPSNHLRSLVLTIDANSGLEFDMQEMGLECCSLLDHLTLWGRIREQEVPFFFPPNLLSFYLGESRIEKVDDLKGALACLHQLRSLELHGGVVEGQEMTMTGLLQLQKLKLSELENLREWRIDEGSLPRLKELEILYCWGLERIPEEISHIPNIKIRATYTYK